MGQAYTCVLSTPFGCKESHCPSTLVPVPLTVTYPGPVGNLLSFFPMCFRKGTRLCTLQPLLVRTRWSGSWSTMAPTSTLSPRWWLSPVPALEGAAFLLHLCVCYIVGPWWLPQLYTYYVAESRFISDVSPSTEEGILYYFFHFSITHSKHDVVGHCGPFPCSVNQPNDIFSYGSLGGETVWRDMGGWWRREWK